MNLDLAIGRLSFAEARSSGSEALINIARHREEMLDAVAGGKVDAKTTDMADRTRQAQRHHAVDKTV